MDTILKICLTAICAVILISLIRTYKPEFTVETVIATSILLIMFIIDDLKAGFAGLEYIYGELSHGKAYFPVIIKSLGIAYITEFTSELCIDAGEKSIAGKVELAGKIAIFLTALPVFTSLLELLTAIIQGR